MPICALCGENKTNKALHYRYKGGKICRACYKSKVNIKKCSLCQRDRPVQVRIDGNPVCGACYNGKILKAKCSLCRQARTISKRLNGAPICNICYNKAFMPLWKCSICGKKGPAAKRVKGKPICIKCYRINIRSIFIKKFIEMPLIPDTVMFVSNGLNSQKKDFAKQIGFLLETQKAKDKFAEAINVMDKIPSGQKIIRKFIFSEKGKKLKDIFFKITE